jgi:hypothetical protein
MAYKIEVPVPNAILDESSLSTYIEHIDNNKEHIDCIYFPLGHVMENIDIWGIRAPTFVYNRQGNYTKENIHKWEWCLKQIIEYVDIPVKILMNNMYSRSFHEQESALLIQKKLNYYNTNFNVKSVTIADYSVIDLIKAVELPISLSTNSHNSFAELDMTLELYGSDIFQSIVIQRDLNRNPVKLNSYLERRGLHDKAVLMVNEGCINGCPYKIAGDIEIGMSDIKTKDNVIHGTGCNILKQGHAWTFLTSPFLTKQMVDEFYPKIKTIKLAGRDLPANKIKYQLRHWTTGVDIKLSKILNVFPSDSELKVSDLNEAYIKDVMTCNKECFSCRRCEHYYNSLMGIPDAYIGKVNGVLIANHEAVVTFLNKGDE